MNESYGVIEGQLPDRSIYRGYQASAQTSLAVRPTIGTERNDAPHVLSLILRIVSGGYFGKQAENRGASTSCFT